MCSPIRAPSVQASIRNGSTPWCSTAASCGARTRTRRSRYRSMRSSRIWRRRNSSFRQMRPVVMDSGSRSLRSLGREDGIGIPRDDDGPVFREPWEAQAFALALSLHERGVFSWKEWAAALGEEIRKAQAAGDPDTGETYYRHWLAALERLVAAKGLADAATLTRYADAWGR